MRERYLHRYREQSFAIRAYDMSSVGIGCRERPLAIRIQVHEHCSHRCRERSYEILQIAYGITRKQMHW